MEEKQLAIHVEGLNKVYKLYDHNRDRLVDSLGLSRKKKYREQNRKEKRNRNNK